MPIDVKICGLKTPEALAAAANVGARWVGFVFFERSPRFIPPEDAAALAPHVPPGVERVGLVVDAGDEELARIANGGAIDVLQLHGKETPERTRAVRDRFEKPVIKAIPVAAPGDLAAAEAYADVADMLLFDAKPPKGADRPGGNAVSFDWRLMRDARVDLPWLLAGGLDPENVADAVRISGARAVDVSSGVEDAPGIKSPERIRRFMDAVKAA